MKRGPLREGTQTDGGIRDESYMHGETERAKAEQSNQQSAEICV